MNQSGLRICGLLSSVLLFILLVPQSVLADKSDTGKTAATCSSIAGVFLEKGSDQVWKAVKTGAPLPSGQRLVAMPRAELMAASKGVKATLLADIGERGPFPVLEAGVTLHDAVGVDLDLTFERGMLVLENLKDGEAKVRLRVRDETWLFQLQTPGTKLGLEIFGRHPPGLPSVLDGKTDNPTTDVLMIVLAGRVFLDTGTEGRGMQAPPGVARLHWDSVGRAHTFQRLEKLPETIVKPLDEQETKLFKEMSAAAASLAQGTVSKGLDGLLHSANKLDRRVGLTLAGAVDEWPSVVDVLAHSKDPATRDHAIIVLRHWLGRESGQVARFQTSLMTSKKVTEVQARSVLHLLFGFDAEERGHPDTYTVLLTYLDHKNQAVRALAHWHLVRLVPGGRDIAYDAAGPEEQRRQALERWRALVPDGQLPLRLKAEAPRQP